MYAVIWKTDTKEIIHKGEAGNAIGSPHPYANFPTENEMEEFIEFKGLIEVEPEEPELE